MREYQGGKSGNGLRVVSEHPVQLPDPPRVFLPLKEAEKLWGFVRGVAGEINGLGLVEAVRTRYDFRIEEVFILAQSASAGDAEIDGPAFNRYVATCEDPGKIRFQWHSHGKIGVFFSGKDLENISKWTGEYLISLVVNKAGKYECRLDIFEPMLLSLAVPLYIVVPIGEETARFCRGEIKSKVQESLWGKARRFLPGQGAELLADEGRTLAFPLSSLSFAEEETGHD